MNYLDRFQLWLNKAQDSVIKNQLAAMSNDDVRKQLCFDKNLEFGTAGLRGVMDAGTNCLNVYTVAQVSMGLARYMQKNALTSIAVSYDNRHNSQLFARTASAVFASCGIKVYLTSVLQPTPFLSYMVRYFHTDCGVMVTASHNAKEYNGYKVYGSDGCQITEAVADGVTRETSDVDMFDVDFGGFDKFVKEGKIVFVGEEVVESFLSTVLKFSVSQISDITVVYSALNGTGHYMVPEILKRTGLTKLHLVDEQCLVNGDFATCPYPNPEKIETLALGIDYAKKYSADLLIATDPDCDRVGVAVLHNGEYVRLSGQEIGILLADYLLSSRKANHTLPEKPILIKTIVTTNLINKLAAVYNGVVPNLLTGFKYIGSYITELERKGEQDRYILGFEESCGYLIGSYVRDKDAVGASMLIAQMCSDAKKIGITLIDKLDGIYAKYGKYHHKQISFKFDGVSGQATMDRILAFLREKPLEKIFGLKVLTASDLLGKDMPDLPRSNVLIYALEGNAELIIRPSGTEPLIKAYLTAVGDDEKASELFDGIYAELKQILK